MESKKRELYYSYLANSGSFWGIKIHEAISLKKTQYSNDGELSGEIQKILSTRKSYNPNKLNQKEKIEIYKLSLPFYLKWLFTQKVLTMLTVPLFAIILFLPLHFLKPNIEKRVQYSEPTNRSEFIITSEIVNYVLDNTLQDITPLSPPMIRIITP